MSRSYTQLVQTGRANVGVYNGDFGYTGDNSVLDFRGSSVLTTDIGNSIVVAIYPTIGSNTTYFTTATNANPLPVNVTGNINVPTFLDGTTVGANYWYPYYQNTSTTANGYVANSTASFSPKGASQLLITNGTDNWYSYMDADCTSTFASNAGITLNFGTQFVANANTTIQVVPFISGKSTPTVLLGFTDYMYTFELIANRPYQITGTFNIAPVIPNDTQALGLLVRNGVASTRVNMVSGTAQLVWSPV